VASRYHELAAGGGAGKPDRRLCRLGARVREAQLLDAGHELDDEFGGLACEAMRESDVPAEPGHGLLDRLPHEGGRVTEEVDAVAHAVVDVRVPVEIADRRPVCLLDHELLTDTQPGIARLAARDVARDLVEGGA